MGYWQAEHLSQALRAVEPPQAPRRAASALLCLWLSASAALLPWSSARGLFRLGIAGIFDFGFHWPIKAGERLADVRRALHGVDAGGAHGFVFLGGGALPSADDRAGVAHAASRGRGLPGDEADDRLLYILPDEVRGDFFRVSADFADHDDGVRIGIVVEQLDGIEERGADDRIAADADAGRLADARAS